MTTVTDVDVHTTTVPPYNPIHPDIGIVIDPASFHSVSRDKCHRKRNEKRCVRYERHAAYHVAYPTAGSLYDGTRYRT